MLLFKKQKIKRYLNSLGDNKSPFDLLLSDYISGEMKRELQRNVLANISIHVDWSDDVKCIGVQGKYMPYYIYIDIQIYPDEFIISYDPDEPDEGDTYTLNSRDQVYNALLNTIKTIHAQYS